MCHSFLFQAEDGIRDLVRSRGLGDVYKRQGYLVAAFHSRTHVQAGRNEGGRILRQARRDVATVCLLYTSDAADERSSVDLGGRRIIKKKNKLIQGTGRDDTTGG